MSAGGAEGKIVNWADRNHLKLLTKNLKWVLYSSSQLSYSPVTMSNVWEMLVVRVYVYSVQKKEMNV